ncbi:MAG: site-specific integrase [Bacteroidetes bacterium]|nr:site-specific integrase [Bacteroidota bacterium]
MASVKIILRNEKKSDGLFPLAIRITKDRKSSYIYLEYRIALSDWDKKSQKVKRSHPNHVRLNNYLLQKLAESNDQALEIETKKSHVSAKAVRNKIKPSTKETFFAQAQAFLNYLKTSGKYNQYTSDKPRISHFKTFLHKEDIAFSDINAGLLDRFVAYLKSSHKPKRGKNRIGDRTIANHLVTLRSVYAFARKNGIVAKHESPFGDGGIKIKFPESSKIGLSINEISALETVALVEPSHNHARNLWLIAFYFAGMRASDVLRMRWHDIQNERLHYTMGKNKKTGSLMIADKARKILDQYITTDTSKSNLIFPDLKGCDFTDAFKTQRSIAFRISAIDKCLRLNVAPAASIEKKLTMHLARHSFAQLATGVDIRTLQYMFRHNKLETTEGYMGNFVHHESDAALTAIINKTKAEPL